LQRLFKKNLNCTPSQWLRELRCKLAQELIAQGYSSKAAAAELKFASQAHFCRVFKDTFGSSPQSFAPHRQTRLRMRSNGKVLDFSTAPAAGLR
jgi:AraC-like DNA-binding protein